MFLYMRINYRYYNYLLNIVNVTHKILRVVTCRAPETGSSNNVCEGVACHSGEAIFAGVG